MSSYAPIRLLGSDGHHRAFFVEDLRSIAPFWKTFGPNDYIYVQLSWHVWEKVWTSLADRVVANGLSPKRFIILANTIYEEHGASDAGFSTIYCNHNAWLDENIFAAESGAIDREYDIVLITRPEAWKRPDLARLCANIAVVKGHLFRPNEYYELSQLHPAFINDQRLKPEDVAKVISKSWVGGCFSAEEGACYSSSEMLLQGIPVVSTDSRGGRDVWYDDYNSLIVPPDPECVRDAVSLLKSRLISGEIDPAIVRQNHIRLSHEFRNRFYDHITNHLPPSLSHELIQQHSSGLLYRHKMVEYHNILNLPPFIIHCEKTPSSRL